jgi:CheY-like chemotaxis protein
MSEDVEFAHRRILLIDDNPAIHEDFGKIFGPGLHSASALADSAAALYGEPADAFVPPLFQVDSAFQGEEGLRCVCRARDENRPYAMAFVDMRMPPGWDGIETVNRIWECDAAIQIVVCTAYSDHTWEGIREKLGRTDRLIILQKPFDNVEVLQLADALTEKWRLARQAGCRLQDLERRVEERTQELRAANTQLQISNRELAAATERATATTEAALAASQATSEFFVDTSHGFRTTMSGVMAMSDLLLKTSLDPQQSDYVEIIRDSAIAVLGVINEVLDFSEAGTADLEPANSSVTLLPPRVQHGREKWRILVADDNTLNRKVTCLTVEWLGYRADAVNNGRAAVDAWQTGGYDLIIMDCKMPDLDGYEATREIRGRERDGRHIPIIALTANALAQAEAECKFAGMDAYVAKPIDRQRLENCLVQFLDEPTG